MLEIHAIERSEPIRSLYRTFMQKFVKEQLVFLDESHCQAKDFRRKYGYGFRGLPAYSPVANSAHGDSVAACAAAAVCLDGVLAVTVIEGELVDSNRFLSILQDEVLPRMQPYPLPNSVLIMDNAPSHPALEIAFRCQQKGVIFVNLPPYSYDYNPIELVFHQAKDYIRRKYGMDTAHAGNKLFEGIGSVSAANIASYFRHCGYG